MLKQIEGSQAVAESGGRAPERLRRAGHGQPRLDPAEIGDMTFSLGQCDLRLLHLHQHAVGAAVIDDADQPPSTLLDADIDTSGARVDGVLDEFLYCCGRALDDLAGGDLIDEDGVEAADEHAGNMGFRAPLR